MKGSGANHYPRAPAPFDDKRSKLFKKVKGRIINLDKLSTIQTFIALLANTKRAITIEAGRSLYMYITVYPHFKFYSLMYCNPVSYTIVNRYLYLVAINSCDICTCTIFYNIHLLLINVLHSKSLIQLVIDIYILLLTNRVLFVPALYFIIFIFYLIRMLIIAPI